MVGRCLPSRCQVAAAGLLLLLLLLWLLLVGW